MLKGFEGKVIEIIDLQSIKMISEAKGVWDKTLEVHLRFTGVEEWIGPMVPLHELLDRRISVYGWKDTTTDVVEVCAITKISHTMETEE